MTILRPTIPASRVQCSGSHAVIIVGHGSLRRGSGAAMIRIAARLRAAGVAPIVQPAFLNYSRPSVSEAMARCVERGAREVSVVPYFLVSGWFVKQTLPQLLHACRSEHANVTIRQTNPLGEHPSLARLVLQRALEADYLHAFPQIRHDPHSRQRIRNDNWQPLYQSHRTGLLLIAHGSPNANSNRPIYAVAEQVRATGRYAAVTVCFMDINQPRVEQAVQDLANNGIHHAIVVPYFLQLGNHVAEDLPRLVHAAAMDHPHMHLILAEHLGYDRLLIAPVADCVTSALPGSNPARTRTPLSL